jgi:hypothetical protein
MKRKLFTGALLTTFVVGAALISNANSKTIIIPSGTYSLTNPCNLVNVSCTTTGTNPCTNQLDEELFTQDPATGKCTVPLYFN